MWPLATYWAGAAISSLMTQQNQASAREGSSHDVAPSTHAHTSCSCGCIRCPNPPVLSVAPERRSSLIVCPSMQYDTSGEPQVAFSSAKRDALNRGIGVTVHGPPLFPVYPALQMQSVDASLPAGELENVGHFSQVSDPCMMTNLSDQECVYICTCTCSM